MACHCHKIILHSIMPWHCIKGSHEHSGFIYLFLAVLGLRCSAGFSLVAASCGCSPAAVSGLLTELASLVAGRELEGQDFSSCGSWAQWWWFLGSRAQAQWWWLPGALRHLESSQTRDRTRVSCIGRWVLHSRATREAPILAFNSEMFLK